MQTFLTRQKRYGQILGLLTKHDLAWVLDKLNLQQFVPKTFKETTPDGESISLTTPEKIRVLFEELGPTFVKMGQILSTRPDLIPKDFIEQFKQLQDGAKAIPYSEIKEVVESAFDLPIEEIFKEIDETPLAAASIGQVHKVTLQDGSKAVIKVQRPGIEKVIQMDLAILRNFAELAKATGLTKPIDPVAIIKEFESSILQELDFVVEGRKTDEFKTQHSKDPDIVVPYVYWEFTRKTVLTLELMEGIKVSEIDKLKAKGHDCNALASQLVNVILQQVFIYGRFHSDPHPGNLMVLDDGRLALIDFGMSGHFDRHTRRALVDLLRTISDRDHVKTADVFLKHGLVTYEASLPELQQQLRTLFRKMDGGGSTSELAELLMKFIVEHQISFPPDLFFLDKVFGTLDGAVKTLNPNLKMRVLAQSFIPQLAKSVAQDWQQYVKEFLGKLLETDEALINLPNELSKVLKRMDAGYFQVTHHFAFSDKGLKQINFLILKLTGIILGLLFIAAWIMMDSTDYLIIGSGVLLFSLGSLLFFNKG